MQQCRREPIDFGLDPLQMDIPLIPQLGGGEPPQGCRQLTQRHPADMAGGLAQRAQPLGERRDIGDGGGSRQPAHDLLRVGPKRLDHIAEESLLAAQLAQRLDAARIDDWGWLRGEPGMGGNRGHPVAEQRRVDLGEGRLLG